MSAPSVAQAGRDVIWWDAAILPRVMAEHFDTVWLGARGYLRGAARGRGQAQFLEIEGRQLVLRHFARGGLIGRLVRDSFLRLGAGRSRAFREFHLLALMRDQGLPVPRPVAARYAPLGLVYRADLITERIAGAVPLAEALQGSVLPEGQWRDIGRVIARMHGLGVDHVDLNCRNILLDGAGGAWLIDFDRCRRRAGTTWAPGNLARLHRSLVKERGAQARFFWSDGDWAALIDGYRARPVSD
jgi:tRNA A-37 threonylcarbamoyl transferase component Bud32